MVKKKLLILTEATGEKKMNIVQTNAAPCTIQDHKLCKKIWIQAPRRTIINTDGEEETGTSQMGRGLWVTDICYNCIDL